MSVLRLWLKFPNVGGGCPIPRVHVVKVDKGKIVALCGFKPKFGWTEGGSSITAAPLESQSRLLCAKCVDAFHRLTEVK